MLVGEMRGLQQAWAPDFEAADILCHLWQLPQQPAAPTSSRSSGTKRPLPAPQQQQQHVELSSDEELSDDEEYKPSKVRVIQSGTTGTPIVLPRRSYTWRGASRRQQPLEGAAESTAAPVAAAPPPAALQQPACVQPTSSGNMRPASSGRGTVSSGGAAAQLRPAGTTAAAASCVDTKEGDKEWAALTTWLRMNLHNPRTAKKVVLFVGQRDEAGCWAFGLNPALTWSDLSLDTKLRLRDLMHEAEAAFGRKYPARPSGDWRKKAQKYKTPGSSQTFQVPLEHLIPSLHALYERYEGATPALATSSGGSLNSCHTGCGGGAAAAGASPAPAAATPTHSHCS